MAETLFDTPPYRVEPPERSEVDRIAEVLERHQVQDVVVQRRIGPMLWWECICDWQTLACHLGDKQSRELAQARAFRHVAEQVVAVQRLVSAEAAGSPHDGDPDLGGGR